MPDCGVHYLWVAFVCLFMRSRPPVEDGLCPSLSHLHFRRVLDVASAWGDRLLAAIAYDLDMYVGVDANPDLEPGYEAILEQFVAPEQRHRFPMLISPSEKVALPEGVQYDLVLMSPAPYRTEVYSNPRDQASNYATYEQWLVDYFFATLRKVCVCVR